MRAIMTTLLLLITLISFGQTHIEYVSEKTDSMALISKQDIDVINNVFNERNILDSLYNLNEQIISNLEFENRIQDSIILNQEIIISNNHIVIDELKSKNSQIIEVYSKELKKEKRKKISFQSLTGAGIITIILLILL